MTEADVARDTVEHADSDEAAALRDEVRAWLAATWSPDRPRKDFLAAVVDAGWAAPRWPAASMPRPLANCRSSTGSATSSPATCPTSSPPSSTTS